MPSAFCVGQEAVPAVLSQVKKKDYLFSHHKHMVIFVKDKMRELFAELRKTYLGLWIYQAQDNFFSGAILAGAASIAMGYEFENVK